MNGHDITACMEMIKNGARSNRGAGKIAGGMLLLRGQKWHYVVVGWCLNIVLVLCIIGLIKLFV